MNAEKLKRLRHRDGLSLRGLAKLAGIGHTTLWRLEKTGGNPREETLVALARALDVAAADLLDKERA